MQGDEINPSIEDLQALIEQLRAENSSLRVQLSKAGLEPKRAAAAPKRPKKFRVTLPSARAPPGVFAWLVVTFVGLT